MKVNWKKEKDNLEELITNGTPYEQIGKMYGVCGNAVKKAAKKLGISLEYRRKINEKEHFNKGVSIKGVKSYYDECPICGKRKYHTSDLCSECRNKERRNNIKEQTLGYYIDGQKYLATKCNDIRKDAKRTLEESDREKVCEYCHNHEFDDILEVHHIKGILEFDNTAKIKEINDLENLVWLCPNHHRMIELGLIKLK